MDVRPLAVLVLLVTPAAALPPAPAEAPAVPQPMPLALRAQEAPPELLLREPATVRLTVHSGGLAGTGVQPPLARVLNLTANLSSGEAVTLAPAQVVMPAGASEVNVTASFLPRSLGPLVLHVFAKWAVFPGNATLDVAKVVVKDDLSVEAYAAGAPDADLDLLLHATLRSGQLAQEPLAWRVEAEHTPVHGTQPLRWVAAEGAGAASPGGVAWSAKVRARYGAGPYAFHLTAGGERLEDAAATVAVDVPDVRVDSGAVNYTLEVVDHPTTLRLSSDSVNADLKAKRAGDPLVTRVVVRDLNGLGDVDRVTFTYARNDTTGLVPVFARTLEGFGAGIEATVEDRFDLSPLKDAAYVCTVTAEGTGSPTVSRTFVITDAAPTASLVLNETRFLPARAGVLAGTVTVRDANFGTGPLDTTDITALGAFQLILYKGSTRVTEAGWTVAAGDVQGRAPLTLDLSKEGTRSTSWAYRVADGLGQLELRVEVGIPEGATSGAYRLALADDATLASAAFNVTPLPRVTKASLVGTALPGSTVSVLAEAANMEHAQALQLETPWGAVLRATAAEVTAVNGTWQWNASLALPSPLDDEDARNLTVLADLGDGRVIVSPAGAVVNARNVALAVANAAPTLEGRLLLSGASVGAEAWVHPHAAALLTAEATARDANAEDADLRDELGLLQAEVRDWTNALVNVAVDGTFDPAGASLRVRPDNVGPGRYTLTLRARDDDNATAEARLAVNVGTHFRLGVQAPEGGVTFAAGNDSALHASLTLRTLGNAPAGSVAVLAEGLPPAAAATATLVLPNGTKVVAALQDGYARFTAPRLLEAWSSATLQLRIDASSGVPAGLFQGRLVVAGEAA